MIVGTTETSALNFDATALAVSTALNAISDVSTNGGVTVSKAGVAYVITWNTYGSKPSITAGPDTLTPASYQAVSLVQAGGVSTNEVLMVELRQNPIALGTTWTAVAAPSISVTLISAWNGTNKIYRYGVEPDPKAGSYTLDIVEGATTYRETFNFDDDVATISNRINAIIDGSNVYQSGQFQFDIVFTEDVTMTADGSGLIGHSGYVGDVSFNTSEVAQFLNGAARKNTFIEVTLTGSNSQTLIQAVCQVCSDIIAAGINSPIVLPGGLTEAVANDRFVRRDVAQSPDAPTQAIIWGNLGVPRPPADGNYYLIKDDVWEVVTIY